MFLFNKKLSLINKTLSDENIDNTKCKAFYKHLYNFESKDNIISNNVYKDLEIFEDFYENQENSIFNKINKTKTISGEIYLHEKLRIPSNNIELLEKQQNETKIIIVNKLFIKENLVPLGGIKLSNLNKLNLVKSNSFALLSEIKKKPANIINRLF